MGGTGLQLIGLALQRNLLLELVTNAYTMITKRFQALHIIDITQIIIFLGFRHNLKKKLFFLIN